ncbi:PrsW family intramembrane metalloprotease [Flintibacter sp. BX5]|uniref:PrsW family intramembrane metalloprotease n=2 Tax=Flintibacter faecis TaxID=2763047 RepID=A0A8J6M5Z8_9FIRM|nr:PrsW family intramembrane metalloprotease [Flintibacter faecis]
MDGGLLLAQHLPGQPHLLVRYAADPCDSGAAARHEKGGGRMTYIENIFICMVSPLLVAALCMGRRQLRFFLFCIAGMGVCLLSAYINTFLAAVCQADALAATAEIAPVVEEMMKLLPLVFYLLVFEPEGDKIKAAAITVALAFATFENVCYLIQNGADRFSFIFFRGFGTGAMHVLCGLIVGGGLAYTWRRTWLKIAGACGLLGAAITLHAIYNLLIAYGGAAQYIAYALPVLLVAAGRLSAFRLSQRK